MPEHAIEFSNSQGQQLIGVWHEPDEPARASIVMLHGWSGTRSGPHQMLARAARAFCARGFGVLRFDFAGRGDSEGETELATLQTMADDTRAAFDWLENRTNSAFAVVGMCSGCEVAVAAWEPRITAMALWSAPIFAAPPSDELKARKRGANLKSYARKLLKPATYRKLLTGKLDTGAIGKAVAGGGGAAHKNWESGQAGQLPMGFRKKNMEHWKAAKTPLLLIYGTGDPTTEPALAWHQTHYGGTPDVRFIEGANHSFYGLEWEKQTLQITGDWLESRF